MRFDDYILRAIEQLSQAIASILARVKAGSVDEAEVELSKAYEALLGHDRVFLDMVDSQTLANLLGAPAKTRGLAQLSMLDAKLCEQRGDATRAARLRQRAQELAAIAHRDDPQADDATLLSSLN